MIPADSSRARRTRCARCGQEVLRQLVGRRAALDVTADDEPLTVAEAEMLREPNRLHWCLRETSTGIGLRWRKDCRAECPHPHVIDHHCPPGTPPGRRPEGALW